MVNNPGDPGGDLWKLTYEYGELNENGTVNTAQNTGNIAKQTITFSGLSQPFIQTYKYDSLYRIIEGKETKNGTQTWKQQFGYDRYGNRTSFYQNVGGQVLETTPAISAATNRFTSTNYAFDQNGNLTRDIGTDNQTRTVIFNGDNKQSEVKNANGITVGKYYYDGEGKRIKKVTDLETTVFVYSSGKLVAEYSTAPPPPNPTINYTATDMLGSPRVITNSLGEVTSRRDFMPFGEELFADGQNRTTTNNYSQTGQDAVRQRFTGYEKDIETGLDFAQARMYENRHGRFTAVDPLLASGKSANPQTFNRYVYVMNSPLKFNDPSGLQAATNPQNEENEVIRVHTFWDSAKNRLGTYVGYLKSLGLYLAENAQGCVSACGGGNLNEATIISPETQQFKNLGNSTRAFSANAFNANMNSLNENVIQRTPFLGNLTNAGMAGLQNDSAGFAKEMGLFAFDLGTSFSGGGTTRRVAREGVNLTGTKLSWWLGQEGEKLAGLLGAKTSIPSLTNSTKSGFRIVDSLNPEFKLLQESKNVAYQPLTKQIIDFHLYAQENKFTFQLIMRENTRVSRPLQNMFDKNFITPIFELPAR